MQGNSTDSDYGRPQILVSDGKQHPAIDWALVTAKHLLDATNLVGEKAHEALKLQMEVVSIVAPIYEQLINDEHKLLQTVEEHCSTDFNVNSHVVEAINKIKSIPQHLWSDLIASKEWMDAAEVEITKHFMSALHVERLWFADDHPENELAQTYKARFVGTEE